MASFEESLELVTSSKAKGGQCVKRPKYGISLMKSESDCSLILDVEGGLHSLLVDLLVAIIPVVLVVTVKKKKIDSCRVCTNENGIS